MRIRKWAIGFWVVVLTSLLRAPISAADAMVVRLALLGVPVAAFQVPSYWIEVMGHCADAALFRYELSEVIALLQERNPSVPLDPFAFSGGGTCRPVFESTHDLLEELQKKRSFWGRSFPAARAEARQKLRPTPKHDEQKK